MLVRNRGRTVTFLGADLTPTPETLSFKQRIERIHFSEDDIPDHFIDHYISHDIMENPVILDNCHIMDLQSLTEWWEKVPDCKNFNPVTRKHYNKMEPLPELKKEIDQFIQDEEQTFEFLDIRIRNRNQRILEKLQKRKIKLEALNQTRETLIQDIQKMVEAVDPQVDNEQQLQLHVEQLEMLDRKKLRYETPLTHQIYISQLRERVQELVEKQERAPLNEIETAKLNKLLGKLDGYSGRNQSRLSRYTVSFFHPGESKGLLVLNQRHTPELYAKPREQKEDI